MIVALFNVYLVVLFILVKTKIVPFNLFWKCSPLIVLLLLMFGLFVPMGWGAPQGPAMNKETALDLDGTKVCVQTGTTTELNLADYFRTNKMLFVLVAAMTLESAIKGYDSGQCNVLTADISALFGIRLLLSKPDDHVILPDVISKEPLGPAVRQDDVQWFNIVKWVHFAMPRPRACLVNFNGFDPASTSQTTSHSGTCAT